MSEQAAPERTELLLGPNTLQLLGIADPSAIEVVSPWRPGGETYVTDFRVTRGEETRHLIAQACIKFFPVETVQEWLGRRAELHAAGVAVPEIALVDRATVVEEYIPHTFGEAYRGGDPAAQESLRQAFHSAYAGICAAGFWPRSLHDVRSHGEDVVVVDFGSDLGPVQPRDAAGYYTTEAAGRWLSALIR